jgi:hypothetical protein
VGSEQRDRTIHDVHAPTFQPRQAPKPGLDPVECWEDVEAGKREIALPKARRDGRGELHSLPKIGKGRGKSAIRLCRLAEDDDRAAPTCRLWRPRRGVLAPVDRDVDAGNCHRASSAVATKVGLKEG